MNDTPRFGLVEFLCLLVVVGAAAGVRVWYVAACAADARSAPAFIVQGQGPTRSIPGEGESGTSAERSELEDLVHHLHAERAFERLAPLADRAEETADVAPGYPWVLALARQLQDEPAVLIRWGQCVLGALTILCYFFFARQAFGSTVIATVAGLLGAFHPFWIINTAELADGVLVTFLLAAALALGTRGSQMGGSFTSLLFGLTLAALAMVRAALLPFALVAFIWYLARCRTLRTGWFAAMLALLGFANGLAPWAVRNWQVFAEPLPVVDSAYLHLWMGNNARATGGVLDEKALRESLRPELREILLTEADQPRRYARLGPEVVAQIGVDPAAALGHRIDAGLCFFVGERWLLHRQLGQERTGDGFAEPPRWIADWAETALRGGLLALLILAVLGWRWSAGWGWQSRLTAIAAVWVPLPYLLSHAEELSGPRLPLDGVFLCYAAFAACALATGFNTMSDAPPDAPESMA